MITLIIVGLIGAVSALIGTGGIVVAVKTAKKSRNYDRLVAKTGLHCFGADKMLNEHPEMTKFLKDASKINVKKATEKEEVKKAISNAL